jgi:hypothetical protein
LYNSEANPTGGKEMKKTFQAAILVLILILFTNPAWGSLAVPVSPGGPDGYAMTNQACPTFSWSAAEGATGYRIEVYETGPDTSALYRDLMRQMARPVISSEISSPALAWTPSSGECLERGVNYVWFVQAVASNGEGPWSEGKVFSIDSLPDEYLTDFVKETVDSYLSNAWTSTDSYTQVKEEIKKEITGEAKISSAQETIGIAGYESSTNTLYGSSAGTTLLANNGGAGPPDNNTFIGNNAGNKTTSGSYSWDGDNNTFLGYRSGHNNTTGYHNTFSGSFAGFRNTTGYYNSFTGAEAGYHNETGHQNTFSGTFAGYYNFTGMRNTYIGRNAGYTNQTGSDNVFLGYRAGYYEAESQKLYIANSSTTSPLIYGEFNNNLLKINGTLIMASDGRLKKDIEPINSALEKVMLLNGVSYKWKSAEGGSRGFASDREIGLLAQNVETVLPELVHTDGQGYKAVAYDKMVAVVIEAMKEQQKEMKEKDTRIAKLSAIVEELSTRIAAMEGTAKTIAAK